MKEFVLTQSYATIEDMLNSGEVAVYKEELMQGDIDFYAIVSRIGNRYDIYGNKIEGYVQNPYLLCQMSVCEHQEEAQNVVEPIIEIEHKKEEEIDIKYANIENLIDAEIENAVAQVKIAHEQKIATLKEQHEKELAEVKEQAKAELIAKLNA